MWGCERIQGRSDWKRFNSVWLCGIKIKIQYSRAPFKSGWCSDFFLNSSMHWHLLNPPAPPPKKIQFEQFFCYTLTFYIHAKCWCRTSANPVSRAPLLTNSNNYSHTMIGIIFVPVNNDSLPLTISFSWKSSVFPLSAFVRPFHHPPCRMVIKQ